MEPGKNSKICRETENHSRYAILRRAEENTKSFRQKTSYNPKKGNEKEAWMRQQELKDDRRMDHHFFKES